MNIENSAKRYVEANREYNRTLSNIGRELGRVISGTVRSVGQTLVNGSVELEEILTSDETSKYASKAYEFSHEEFEKNNAPLNASTIFKIFQRTQGSFEKGYDQSGHQAIKAWGKKLAGELVDQVLETIDQYDETALKWEVAKRERTEALEQLNNASEPHPIC